MKVIQVTPRYYPDIGGIETHVREICRRLVRRKLELLVVTTDPSNNLKKDEIIDGINVTRLNTFAPYDSFYFSPGIYSFVKKNKCDIIHVHGYHVLSSLFAAMSKTDRNKLIFTPHYHGVGHTFFRNILNKLYKPVGAMIFNKAGRVVCVSKYEMNLIKNDFNIPDNKIVVIPNGIDPVEFEGIKAIAKEQKTLLYIGRLEEYKGIHYIIKALSQLPDYRLEIIGRGVYKNELRRLADEYSVNNRIDWLENIPRKELLEHYASANLFLMLSSHEAFCITVAEALTVGIPCIVATGSALDEFVDGKMCAGVTLPIGPEELAQKIKSMISKDRTKYGRKIMSWDEVVGHLIESYGNL